MAVATLDTHELVKELKSALSDLATRADLAVLRAEIANLATKAELSDMRTDIVKWVFGIALGQAALIIALMKLLPGGHP